MKTSLLPCSLNLVVISRPPQYYHELYTVSHGLYSNLIAPMSILTTSVDNLASLIVFKAYGTLNASIGTLTASIGTLTASIGTLYNVHCGTLPAETELYFGRYQF
jgi:hypothetical protein